MLRNGLCLVVDLAVREVADPLSSRYRRALLLGSLREDVLFLPLVGRVTEYPSFSHFYAPGLPGGFLPFVWPGPRRAADRLYARALREARAGRRAAAFVLLGRVLHLIADMSIPSHTHRVAHDHDPFEWYIEGNAGELRRLPLPLVDPPRRAADLIESLARASARFAPDATHHPLGRLLRRLGLRQPITARVAAEQARALVPLAAGHAAAMLRLFLRDARAPS